MIKTFLALTAAALVSASALAAQTSCLTAVVLDPDGLPTPGAAVRLGGRAAETGPDGEAELCGARNGRRTLTVEADGFAPVTRSIDPGDSRIEVRLTLRRVVTPVVVTGTPEPRQLAEVNRTLNVLPAADPDVPAFSFADVLKQDASIHVRERGPDGTQADLSIRGSSFDQTLVLINGMRVSDAQTGHHSLDLPLPFESVQQVEVLRGGGATLYGSDAVGGTLNFVTKKPERHELRLMGGLGDFGWNRWSASGAFQKGPWTQTVSAARDFSEGFLPGRDFRNLSLLTETFYDTKAGTTSALFGWNDRPFGANQFYGNWDSWEKTGTKFVSLAQTLGRESGVRQRMSFAYRRHTDHFVLFRYQPEIFQNSHALDTWQGSYSASGDWGGRARWTAGAQYFSEDIESNSLGDRLRHRAAIFGVLDLRPTDRLNVSLGIREEAWKRWRAETVPTASVGYWLGGGVKVRGQLGRAFRMPTYTDLYYRDPGNVGNPNLGPETAWNYEAGLDWYAPHKIEASATWFERQGNNTIDWVKRPGSNVFEATGFQELDFRGGELELRRRMGVSSVWANYAVLRATQTLPDAGVSRYVFNFPLNQASLGYSGPVGGGLLIKTQLGVYNRTWQSTKALWDVRLGYAAGRFRPFVQATNLLNTAHEAFQGLPQPGRWIRGGVEWRVF